MHCPLKTTIFLSLTSFFSIKMTRIYQPNHILWLEDDVGIADEMRKSLNRVKQIEWTYGELKRVISEVKDNLGDGAVPEIEKIIREAGNDPSVIILQTPELGRTYFERYTPAAAITDAVFQMNGKEIIEWLCIHGLEDYPLLGHSGRKLSKLPSLVQEFFEKPHTLYLRKGGDYDSTVMAIAQHLVFARGDTMFKYGPKEF